MFSVCFCFLFLDFFVCLFWDRLFIYGFGFFSFGYLNSRRMVESLTISHQIEDNFLYHLYKKKKEKRKKEGTLVGRIKSNISMHAFFVYVHVCIMYIYD
jgi:hypothetical protein